MIKRLLLTRPQGKNEHLLACLKTVGIEADICSLLELQPRTLSPQERQWLYDLDQVNRVISISAFASQCFVEAVDALWPQWPIDIKWLAVGKAAKAPLSAEQLDVLVPKSATSEGLLNELLPQSLLHEKIMLIQGVGGRDVLAKTLHERGAEVRPIAFYERSLPSKPFNFAALFERSDAIQITSAQAFEHLRIWAESLPHFHNKLYIVPSQRIADHIERAGCTAILLSAGASDEDLLAALGISSTP